jgi:hypothetical protein
MKLIRPNLFTPVIATGNNPFECSLVPYFLSIRQFLTTMQNKSIYQIYMCTCKFGAFISLLLPEQVRIYLKSLYFQSFETCRKLLQLSVYLSNVKYIKLKQNTPHCWNSSNIQQKHRRNRDKNQYL